MGKDRNGKERKGKERKGKEGKERNGRERKGKDRKGMERNGKERKGTEGKEKHHILNFLHVRYKNLKCSYFLKKKKKIVCPVSISKFSECP